MHDLDPVMPNHRQQAAQRTEAETREVQVCGQEPFLAVLAR